MDYNNKKLLEEEIERQFNVLRDLDVNSEEYQTTLNNLVKLIDRSNESNKIENEHDEKFRSWESDHELKIEQINNDKKDRLFDHIVAAASIIVPTIVTIWGTKVSLKFEETGSVTTIMGRGFINKLLPKK